MGLAARAPGSNKLSAAAIAGVVLGTIAVVALLTIAGVLVYFVFQRRKKPRARKHSKTDVTPFPSDISESTRNSVQTTYGRQPHSPRAGLLDSVSTPVSPDWQTTLLTAEGGSVDTHSNTFPGGTTFNDSHTSHAYYRTEMHSSASLINLESPPPYAVPSPRSGAPPVPLVPLRKNRRLFDA